MQLKPVHLTNAEKADANLIDAEDVLVFHRNTPGVKRGAVVKATEEVLEKAKQYPERFSVFRESSLKLSKGDRIKITKYGKTKNGKHKVYNGNIFDIKKFDRNGNIVLNNGWKLDKDFGHLALGYVTTSHSSQGKTVDHVYVVESSDSFAAAGKEQLYVSASRGRKRVSIFTDDIEEFKQAVNREDRRVTATSLLKTGCDPNHRKRKRYLDKLEDAEKFNEKSKDREYARG